MSVSTNLNSPKRTRTRRTWGIICVIIISIVGLGTLYWNSNKERIVGSKIQKIVSEKSHGLYAAAYDSIQLNELEGRFEITGLHISPDSNTAHSLQVRKVSPSFLADLHIPTLRMSGMKTPKALFGKQIVGRKLEIINPSLDIYYKSKSKDENEQMNKKELYKLILGDLKLLQVDTLVIVGGKLTSHKYNIPDIQVQDISASFYDVKVDSLSDEDDSRILFSSRFAASAEKISWSKPGSLYKNSVEKISFTEAGNVNVGRLEMKPLLGEEAFVSKQQFQGDRFDLSFAGISISGLDMRKLVHEKYFADQVHIKEVTCKIYRDLGKARDTKIRSGYPSKAIRDISDPIDIKKITISNGYIEYKQKNKLTHAMGKVPFYNLNAVITNFSNQDKQQDGKLTASINALLLNKTPVKLNWDFYLSNKEGRFSVSGNAGPIDVRLLNPMTEPMAQARIRDGYLKKLEFDLSGSDAEVKGKVRMLYDDLKVDVLELDSGAKKQDKKFLTSLFANKLIKNSNPKGNDPPREADVIYTRDRHYSVLNASFIALFTGMLNIAGIKKTF